MTERILRDASRYELFITLGLVLAVALFAVLSRRGERRLEEPTP